MQRENGFPFFDLCDFTLCDFSLEHNCHINQGVPVPHFPEYNIHPDFGGKTLGKKLPMSLDYKVHIHCRQHFLEEKCVLFSGKYVNHLPRFSP
jgi:hypothetical protein